MNNNSSLLFLFSLIFITQIVSAQDKHTITLYVDTQNITLENLETTCNFGQEPGTSNENYTVYVNKGDTVTWNGISTTSDQDKVEIIKIEYKSGTNLFGRETLKDQNGVVTATITTGESDQYEKYDIYFRVQRNGRWLRQDFPIDPKLRIKQTVRR
jgi:hypothetical protein